MCNCYQPDIDVQGKKKSPRRRIFLVILQPQILDPGGAEKTEGSPVGEHNNYLWATCLRMPESQTSIFLKTNFHLYSSTRLALLARIWNYLFSLTFSQKLDEDLGELCDSPAGREGGYLLTCKEACWPQDLKCMSQQRDQAGEGVKRALWFVGE